MRQRSPVQSLRVFAALVLVVATDAQAAPVLRFIHSSPTRVRAGEDVVIEGEMTDAARMEKGRVVYRVGGGPWLVEELWEMDDDTFSAILPGARIDADPLEYYVEAIEWNGATTPVFARRDLPRKVPVEGGRIVVPAPKPKPEPVASKPPPPKATPPKTAPKQEPVAAAPPPVGRLRVWEPDDDHSAAQTGPRSHLAEELMMFAADDRVSLASRREEATSDAPAIVSVYTAEQLRALHVRRLADLAKLVPGFETSRDVQGFWRVGVRGRRSDPEILVLLDGHRLNNAYDGRVPWELPLENVDRIEIVRGPGSALYGAGAFAAVVNIVPRRDDGVRAAVTAGSFGTLEASAQGGRRVGDLGVHADVSVERRDGYVEEIRRDAVTTDLDRPAGVTDDRRSSVSGGLRLEHRPSDPKRPSLAASLRAYHEDRGALVGLVDVVGPGSDLSWTQVLGDVATTMRLGPALLRGRFYADANLTDRLFVLYPPGYTVGASVFEAGVRQKTAASLWTIGGEVVTEAEPLDGHEVTAGVQIERQSISSFELRVNANGDVPAGSLVEPTGVVFPQNDPLYSARFVAGVFVQDAWTIAAPLKLTAGLRADTVSRYGLAWNPRIALVWKPVRDLAAKLAFSRAYRAPTFEEALAIVAVSPNLNSGQVQGFAPDDPLKPVTVLSAEAGLEGATDLGGGRATVRTNAFLQLFENPIEVLDTGSTPRLGNRRDGVRVAGVEAEARWDWPGRNGSTVANVSWVRARDLETDKVAPDFSLLTDVPQLRANWMLVLPLADVATLSLVAQFGSERRNNARTPLEATRRFRIPAYGLVGAGLRSRKLFDHVELALQVQNVTDLSYLDDVPRPDDRRMPGLLPREGVHGFLTLRAGFP